MYKDNYQDLCQGNCHAVLTDQTHLHNDLSMIKLAPHHMWPKCPDW